MEYTCGHSCLISSKDSIISYAQKLGEIASIISYKHNKAIGLYIHRYKNSKFCIKIASSTGVFLSSDDSDLIKRYIKKDFNYQTTKLSSAIFIGIDNHEYCTVISSAIVKGIYKIDNKPHIIHINDTIYPNLALKVNAFNKKINYDYFDEFFRPHKIDILKGLTIDTANGISSKYIRHIVDTYEIHYLKRLNWIHINNNTSNTKLIDKDCGPEYIIDNRKLPTKHYFTEYELDEDNVFISASISSIGDKIVFYHMIDGILIIFNGFDIAMLYKHYIQTVLKDAPTNVIVMLHNCDVSDRYTNTDINVKIMGITDMKSMFERMESSNITIFFTKYGLGGLNINDPDLLENNDISLIHNINNEVTPDGISNLFMVVTILKKLSMTPLDWKNLVTEK